MTQIDKLTWQKKGAGMHSHRIGCRSTATHMPKPQACSRGCAGCPREVAQSQISRVIAVTANSWGVA